MSCAVDEDCSDGLYCNGDETCVETICQAGSFPCNESFEECDEDNDACVLIDDGCVSDLDCLPSEYCDTNTGICQPDVVVNCGADAGNCFVSNFTPGCNLVACCDIICRFDPSCCFESWDETCRDFAFQFCGDTVQP